MSARNEGPHNLPVDLPVDLPLDIAGVVPAKGTSTRVPGKNRRELLGVPLFLWAANNLARVLPRDRVFVDSDDPEILRLARAAGFGAIERPAALATNATDGNALMRWAASQIGAQAYLQNLPPMPFVRHETLHGAIEALAAGRSAVGVRRDKLYLWDERGPTYDLAAIPNSFDLPDTLIEGMGFYAMRHQTLLDTGVRVPAPRELLALDPFEAIDIDHEVDLELAQAVATGLPSDSPYLEGIAALRATLARVAPGAHAPPPIGLLALDVDGVMTDAGMYVSERGDELKKFNARDGMGIKRLMHAGVEVAFVSSSTHRAIIEARAARLGVTRLHAGPGDKVEVVDTWRRELGLDWAQVAFVGDDLNDLGLLGRVGLAACPADALSPVRRAAHVILERAGGQGCVRELIDLHLHPREAELAAPHPAHA